MALLACHVLVLLAAVGNSHCAHISAAGDADNHATNTTTTIAADGAAGAAGGGAAGVVVPGDTAGLEDGVVGGLDSSASSITTSSSVLDDLEGKNGERVTVLIDNGVKIQDKEEDGAKQNITFNSDTSKDDGARLIGGGAAAGDGGNNGSADASGDDLYDSSSNDGEKGGVKIVDNDAGVNEIGNNEDHEKERNSSNTVIGNGSLVDLSKDGNDTDDSILESVAKVGNKKGVEEKDAEKQAVVENMIVKESVGDNMDNRVNIDKKTKNVVDGSNIENKDRVTDETNEGKNKNANVVNDDGKENEHRLYDYSFYDEFYGLNENEEKKKVTSREVRSEWRHTVDEMIEELTEFLDTHNPCVILKRSENIATSKNDSAMSSLGVGFVEGGAADLRAGALRELGNKINAHLMFPVLCSVDGNNNSNDINNTKHTNDDTNNNNNDSSSNNGKNNNNDDDDDDDETIIKLHNPRGYLRNKLRKIPTSHAPPAELKNEEDDSVDHNIINNNSSTTTKSNNNNNKNNNNNDDDEIIISFCNPHGHYENKLHNMPTTQELPDEPKNEEDDGINEIENNNSSSNSNENINKDNNSPDKNDANDKKGNQHPHENPKHHSCSCSGHTPCDASTDGFTGSKTGTQGNADSCYQQKVPHRPCIDLFTQESVISQLCSKMTSLEDGNRCMTSQLSANQKKTDHEISVLKEEILNLKKTVELLQRSSMFYARTPMGSSKVRGYEVMGQAFQPESGYFKVPYDGVYEITVGCLKRTVFKRAERINVMLGNKTVYKLLVDGRNPQSTFVMSLESGQSLWLKTNSELQNETSIDQDLVFFGAVLVK